MAQRTADAAVVRWRNGRDESWAPVLELLAGCLVWTTCRCSASMTQCLTGRARRMVPGARIVETIALPQAVIDAVFMERATA